MIQSQSDTRGERSMDKQILNEQVVGKELEELWEGKAEFPQITEPTYWISHEYKEIKKDIVKLNEKMDLILNSLPSRKRKCTTKEVNEKMVDLINYVNMN